MSLRDPEAVAAEAGRCTGFAEACGSAGGHRLAARARRRLTKLGSLHGASAIRTTCTSSMAGGRVGAPLLAALQSARSRRLSRRSATCLWYLPSSRRGCAGCGESQRAPRSTPRADACCFSSFDPAAAAAVATPRTDARRRSPALLHASAKPIQRPLFAARARHRLTNLGSLRGDSAAARAEKARLLLQQVHGHDAR